MFCEHEMSRAFRTRITARNTCLLGVGRRAIFCEPRAETCELRMLSCELWTVSYELRTVRGELWNVDYEVHDLNSAEAVICELGTVSRELWTLIHELLSLRCTLETVNWEASKNSFSRSRGRQFDTTQRGSLETCAAKPFLESSHACDNSCFIAFGFKFNLETKTKSSWTWM